MGSRCPACLPGRLNELSAGPPPPPSPRWSAEGRFWGVQLCLGAGSGSGGRVSLEVCPWGRARGWEATVHFALWWKPRLAIPGPQLTETSPRRPWREARQLLLPAGCPAMCQAPLSAGVGVGSGGRFPCGSAGAGRRSDSALAPGGVLRFSCMFLVTTDGPHTWLEQADAFASGAAPARPS